MSSDTFQSKNIAQQALHAHFLHEYIPESMPHALAHTASRCLSACWRTGFPWAGLQGGCSRPAHCAWIARTKKAPNKALFLWEARCRSVATAAEATVAVANIRAVACAELSAATGAATLFTRLGQVNHDGATVDGHAVERLNGCLRSIGRCHLDKSKAFGATAVAIHHDLGGSHGAEFGKVTFQAVVRDGIRKITNVDFVAHEKAFL